MTSHGIITVTKDIINKREHRRRAKGMATHAQKKYLAAKYPYYARLFRVYLQEQNECKTE